MRSRLSHFHLCAVVLIAILFSVLPGNAQEKPKPATSDTPVSKPQFPAAKKQPAPATPVEESDDLDKGPATEPDKDSPEQIRKREEWFYKQRSSANGHIPAGARFKAFQHMQRMMAAEGKLLLRPDGSYVAAVAPKVGAASSPAWTPVGPAPTTGGFFSPVSGRVTTIAVDPSDTTGNTVLIGGAQGGIWRSPDAGLTWTAVGDQNPSLAMGSIAFANPSSPGGAGVVYAGTGEQASVGFDVYYGAGVLKSTDSGLTWKQTCNTPSPTCPFIGPFSTFTFGFFSDGGARISYLSVNPTNPNLVLAAAQIPQTNVSESVGAVYCSDDGGTTWSSIPSASGEMATFVGFANATTAYAALGRTSGTLLGAANPNGIYKSMNADGGSAKKCSNISFSNVTANGIGGFPTSSIGRIDLGIAPSDATGKTVYASVADASIDPATGRSRSSRTNLGVFKTLDGGNTWTNTNAPDICQRQCWYDNVIKVDPGNPTIVFFGGGAHVVSTPSSITYEWVMRSKDGGTTWNPAIPTTSGRGDPTLPHVDEHALAFVRSTSGPNAGKVLLYLGNDGGVWRTDDAEAPTVTWANLNNFPLQLTQFYPSLSIHPSNPSLGFAGAQDNGSQNFTGRPLSPTEDWTDNQACGDGGWTLIDPVTPSTVYILCQVISLQKSVTSGTPGSFRPALNGIPFTDPVNFIAPMAIDPANPNRLYFGTSKVYQTVDGADNWLALNNGSPLTPNGVTVTLATGGGSSGNVVYAGTSDGLVFRSTDAAPGSATFNLVPGQTQLPPRHPTQILVDPSDPTGRTLYVTFSGFSTSTDLPGHVFWSDNGGDGWADASCPLAPCSASSAGGLPNIPVNDLAIDPDAPGTLYAATDLGVFQGNCTIPPPATPPACSWSTLGTGLPIVAVLSLRLHEPSRTLRAATHGRGAWDVTLNNFSFTGPHITDVTPTFANVGDPQVSLAVNGSGFASNPKILFTLNGTTSALTPTFISPSGVQLVTVIPGSEVLSSGDAQIAVSNPGPPTVTSNAMTFTVLGGSPLLLSCTSGTPAAPPASSCSTPVQTPVPTTSVSLQLTGTNFASSAKVLFNGVTAGITTTVTDSQHLTATLPSNLLGGYGSTDDIVILNVPPGGGKSLPLTFQVVAPPPPNDNFAGAIAFTSTGGQIIVDSSGATTDPTDPILPCVSQHLGGNGKNGSYNTVWFSFTPGGSGTINDLSTHFSNYDTTLAVFTGTAGNLTMVPNACNDDIIPGVVVQSDLQNIPVIGGTTYYIMVGAFGPPDPNPLALGGYSNITLSFTAGPPDFSIASGGTTTQTVPAGQTATFTNVISVTAQNGFASPVNLSCSLPYNATATHCTVNPLSFPAGNGTASVMVTTQVRGLVPLTPPTGRYYLPPKWIPLLLLTMLLAVLLLRFTRTRRQRLAGALPLAGLVLFLMLQTIGCGSGGYTTGPPPPTGTPVGTYTVTVTATDGGALTHSSTLTLIVQ